MFSWRRSRGPQDQARAVLEQAVARGSDLGDEGWHANNVAQLGHLIATRGDPDRGLALLDQAWAGIQRTGFQNIKHLIRIMHAEALLIRGSREDLQEAVQTLQACIKETQMSRMLRSEILANSVLALVHLAQDDVAAARECSDRAIDRLGSAGGRMPALRAEIVLLRHVEVLLAAGLVSTAEGYLRQAHAILLEKTRSLPQGEARDRFRSADSTYRRVEVLMNDRELT
jgi:hypothetical protein